MILYIGAHLVFYWLFLADLSSRPFLAVVEVAAFFTATALLSRVKFQDPGYVVQNLELPQFQQKEVAESRICETCQVRSFSLIENHQLFTNNANQQHHPPDIEASAIQTLSSLQPMCGSV